MKILSLLAVAAVSGVAASSIFAGGRHVLACSVTEGTVNTYVPGLSLRSCHSPMGSLPPLYATETLTTQVGGSFDFATRHLNECRQVPTTTHSIDTLFPGSGIALIHLAGLTWCRHNASDKQGWLKTKNKKVFITPIGTILGLDTTKAGTMLKVADGAAIVTVPGRHPIEVPQRTQLLIPVSGPPVGRPTKAAFTPTDIEAITELELGVERGGSQQFSEYLRVRKRSAAAVIAQDAATAKQQTALLPNVKVTQLLAPELLSDPQQAAAQLKQLAAGGVATIITVGSFAQMTPIWQLIRGTSLPTTEVVLFASTG